MAQSTRTLSVTKSRRHEQRDRDERCGPDRLRGDVRFRLRQGHGRHAQRTPGARSKFIGWTGACTGTGGCVVTMADSASVTANFRCAADYDKTDYRRCGIFAFLNGVLS